MQAPARVLSQSLSHLYVGIYELLILSRFCAALALTCRGYIISNLRRLENV